MALFRLDYAKPPCARCFYSAAHIHVVKDLPLRTLISTLHSKHFLCLPNGSSLIHFSDSNCTYLLNHSTFVLAIFRFTDMWR